MICEGLVANAERVYKERPDLRPIPLVETPVKLIPRIKLRRAESTVASPPTVVEQEPEQVPQE